MNPLIFNFLRKNSNDFDVFFSKNSNDYLVGEITFCYYHKIACTCNYKESLSLLARVHKDKDDKNSLQIVRKASEDAAFFLTTFVTQSECLKIDSK